MASHPAEAEALRDRQRRDWNLAAPGWGRRRDRSHTGDPVLTERLLALAGVRPGQRVLDLACGVGDPAFALADRVGPTGAVLGLDLSPGMVELARAGAAERGLANVEFRPIESELDLGVPAASFDAATCRFGLMLMPEPARALTAIRRALKPGARAAACTWGPPERVPYFATVMQIVRRHVDLPPPDPAAPGPMALPTPAALAGVFQAAGFAEVETESVEATVLAAETPAAFWDAAVTVSGLLLALLGSLPAKRREAIRDDAIRTLGGMFPEGPVRLGGEALVAAGTNPG